MQTVVLVPLDSNSFAIDVLRLAVSEPALCLAGNPVVEFFLVLLHALVLFELDDFLGDVVVGDSGLRNDGSAEQVVIFGQRKRFLQLLLTLFELFLEDFLRQRLPLVHLLLLSSDQFLVANS